MGTQFYLKIYATSGVVRKADAKKMTFIQDWDWSDKLLIITVGNSMDFAQKELTKIRSKKFSKKYYYKIVKHIFTTECKKQTVITKIVQSGSIN